MTISCACVAVDDDYDSPSFYYAKIRKARKVHKCYECKKPIQPGQKYEHVSGAWDGRIDSFNTCLDCVSIRNVLFCDGYLHGGQYDYLYEHIDNGNCGVDEDCLAALTAGAREKVCGMIEECWERYFDEETGKEIENV